MKNKQPHQMKFKHQFKAAAFTVAFVLPQLTANAAVTIKVSGIVAYAGGDLYSVGQTIDVSFVTSASLGLPNVENSYSSASNWTAWWGGGGYYGGGAAVLDPSSRVAVWDDIAVTGTIGSLQVLPTVPVLDSLRVYPSAGNGFNIALNSSNYDGNAYQGLGLFNGANQLVFISAALHLPLGGLPSWPGTSNSFVENVLPSAGLYSTYPDSFFRLNFDGSGSYDLADISVTFNNISDPSYNVPEPSSVMLLCGAASMLFLRHRKE